MRLSSLAVVLVCALPAKADGPFLALDYDAATARARTENKLLLVDFTATWCPPCKQMDKVTWPDEAVGKWIAEHAIAIQVDVDKAPELAKTFGFDEIPAVILLRDGKELGRQTGFQSSDNLVTWVDALRADTRTSAQRAADDIRQLATTTRPYEMYTLAQDLVRLGQPDEATQAFVRAFTSGRDDATDPNMWRCREMLDDMSKLATTCPAAQEAFGNLVDEVKRRIDAKDPPDHSDFYEWVRLCRSFKRTEDVLRWYDSKRDDKGRLFGGGKLKDPPLNSDPVEVLMLPPQPRPPAFQRDLMRKQVVDLLDEAGRVQDALALMEDPVARAREELSDPICAAFVSSASDKAKMANEMLEQKFYCVAQIYALCLAGGRTEQANQVAALVLPLDKSGMGRTWLVDAAIHRGVATLDPCTRWLDEAAALGAEDWGLRERLPAPEKAANTKPTDH